MPSTKKSVVARSSAGKAAFDTINREKRFRNPPADKTAFPALQEAIRPHVDSWNAVFREGGCLHQAIQEIGEKTVFDRLDGNAETGYGNKLTVRIANYYLGKSMLSSRDKTAMKREIYPAECRERHSSYRGQLQLELHYKVNNGEWQKEYRDCGLLPLMVMGNRCHLENMSPKALVDHKEESEELGGYFVVSGNEKLIRMLIVNRRNYAMAVVRSSYAKRGPSYTNMGVQIRSVRPDQSCMTNVIHYLTDGNITFRFSWRKREYLVPVMMILKALVDTNDREIFEGVVGLDQREDTFLTDRMELLLRTYKVYGLYSRHETLAYLGDKFRIVMQVSPDISDVEVGKLFLRKIVLVNLQDDGDKFRQLLFMIKKLYSLVAGTCAADNVDAAQHQEVLLGGFLYGQILKEKIEEYLLNIRSQIRSDLMGGVKVELNSPQYMRKMLGKVNERIGESLHYFLSTGNLSSPSGLDLQQTTGFTVVAEKLNFYRYISHFRMVHRGSFFAQLKTTTVRKLLPESWGFLCPVHTPDGSPCGLLNHLAHKCHIATTTSDCSSIPPLILTLGVHSAKVLPVPADATLSVQLDGRVLGWCSPRDARRVADTLRFYKVEETHGVPKDLEIGYVPISNGGQYPGIYLFSQEARMIRPVKYIPLDKEDFVGPFEQPFLNIAVTEPEIKNNDSHVEFDPTNILSIVANMTPFSDFNQSPRNMYQCQMGKQTMGTPGTAIRHRTDNKMYILQTGQSPIVRAPLYNTYGLDNFPNGMNAVVAVIAYTGYDMDDAMILNKSAHERGFGYGTVYKTEKYDLAEKSKSKTPVLAFGWGWAAIGADQNALAKYKAMRDKYNGTLDDMDGLPMVGQRVVEGDPIAVYHNMGTGETFFFKYKGSEGAYVEEVRLLGNDVGDSICQAISVKFRITRSPVIGDKFSSRHGQKGVCSQKWPAVDMPFSESGIQPDVIINPHAFPSRMTIGMFVESMAGKAGALHGFAQDSTPFKFNEDHTAVEYFGHQLKEAGYNYYGNEPMYSGITGQEFHADIYLGVVYYQRLRHMVNDKYQVRSTGPVDSRTRQPVKGRKRMGGLRIGEMERDSLLAHGTAFLVQDRLLNCSDYHQTWVCRGCGSFLSTTPTVNGGERRAEVRCRRCAVKASEFDVGKKGYWEDGLGNRYLGGSDTTIVVIPYVLKYLDVELLAMGIQMKYDVSP
ncbi:DNA-directed RNA polymerase I subunit RPA2 [Orbilia ellipsospora]|uniref:DNA-directed RNA polymerase subunit beta n=1 Tax=Orbilia ellipsospora TaxID=2528407 RepID=A0AAV9XEP8_9PEZI